MSADPCAMKTGMEGGRDPIVFWGKKCPPERKLGQIVDEKKALLQCRACAASWFKIDRGSSRHTFARALMVGIAAGSTTFSSEMLNTRDHHHKVMVRLLLPPGVGRSSRMSAPRLSGWRSHCNASKLEFGSILLGEQGGVERRLLSAFGVPPNADPR